MNYLLFTCLSLGAVLTSETQHAMAMKKGEEIQKGDKILTMEEAVLGYELRPESRNMQWQGAVSYTHLTLPTIA